MNKINKYHSEELGFSTEITPIEIVKLVLQKRMVSIKNEPHQAKTKQMIDLILNKSYFEFGGSQMSMDEIDIMKQIFIRDIYRDFSYLTLADIYIACENGVRGKYGEVFRFSPATCYQWVKRYCAQERNKAMKLKGKRDQEELRKQHSPDPANIPSTKQLLLERYNHFLSSEEYDITDYGHLYYDYLNELGLINFSIDEKIDIWNEAQQSLIEQYDPTAAKTTSDKLHFKKVSDLIKNNRNTKPNKHPKKIEIQSESKYISLERVLTTFKHKEVDLKEKLDNLDPD